MHPCNTQRAPVCHPIIFFMLWWRLTTNSLHHGSQTPLCWIQGLFQDADTDNSGYLDADEMAGVVKDFYKKEKIGRSLGAVQAEVLRAWLYAVVLPWQPTALHPKQHPSVGNAPRGCLAFSSCVNPVKGLARAHARRGNIVGPGMMQARVRVTIKEGCKAMRGRG